MHYNQQKNRTLVMRLWERFVEKLCALRPESDARDPHLCHLFGPDGARVVSVRAKLKESQEGFYTNVQVLDERGVVVLEENVGPSLLADSRHPLEELIKFLHKPSSIVTTEVETLQKLLS